MDLVTGAGGFIGGHLVAELIRRGVRLRAVDIKPLGAWHQRFDRVDGVENVVADLRSAASCLAACDGIERVFNLACDMGGIGFIDSHKTACMLNVLINTHLLMAARETRARTYFFSSTACAYNINKQRSPDVAPLRESDAYPAEPEDGYGWEKLFSERMCRHFAEDGGLSTRVARIHNVYGTHGAWHGGREKAPAAICRKVIEAVATGNREIEIWGDGTQTRSFMWIDDCIDGILRLAESDLPGPVNLGSSEMVTVNRLADLAEALGGVPLHRSFVHDAPRGVAGRSSDNTLLREVTGGWEPRTPLETGLARTYRWIEAEYRR